MKLTSRILAAIVATVSSACSLVGLDDTFRNRSNDYRKSAEFPQIEVPEHLDSQVVGELYPIPQGGQVATYQVSADFEVPRPRSVALNDSVNEVKIQKLADKSWILTSVAPSDTWPLVRNFLARQSIPTSFADASRGTIETGWVGLSNDEGRIHQFLISLSQGVQLNTTEIDIVHRALAADALPDVLPDWPVKSDEQEREYWLRDTMASALAGEVSAGTASLSGREIGAAQKVTIVAPETSNPYIDMNLVFERAWASVGYALGNDGFSIAEEAFDEKRYLVNYQNPNADKKSFLGRVFTGSDEENAVSYQVRLEVLGEEKVEVRVFGADGEPLSQRESYIVLEIIRTNLT